LLKAHQQRTQEGETNLYFMNLDGNEKKLFVKDADFARLSSDGSKLVFFRTINRETKVMVCNADGSDVKALTGNQSLWNSHPSFNPRNSSEVVLTQLRGPNQPITLDIIDVENLAGKTLIKGGAFSEAAQFTPDGKEIVYSAVDETSSSPATEGARGRSIQNQGRWKCSQEAHKCSDFSVL
jgi:Tol biopolymer transport system component